jgi:hypothetical protein
LLGIVKIHVEMGITSMDQLGECAAAAVDIALLFRWGENRCHGWD